MGIRPGIKIIAAVLLLSQLLLSSPRLWAKKDTGAEGLSIVFVVDCSDSMSEDNKLEHAKQAARSAIGGLQGKFEIAVIAFFDCGSISVVHGFSSDKESAISAISGLSPHAYTPLAAALSFARGYLLSNAKYENKSMVVLSDGLETCDGDPYTAFPAPSDKGQQKEEEEEDKDYPCGII
jgi:Mg-chelatase subunit ChlD